MDIVRWLIENGADCNARSFVSQQLDDESWTPLHMAATIGKLPIVRTLVEHGAHLDALTDSGETVLCMASPKEVDMDTKAYLLQINAPLWSVPGSSVMVKCRDRRAAAHQWSLLELAVYNGDLLFAEALLQSRHYQDRPALSDFVCHETSLHDREQIAVMQYVQEFISTLQAPSLQRMCRDVLRAYCGTHLRQYVRTVVMPARLRSMLLLEDVLGPLKTSENKEKDDNDS
ncbi:hypothetical protein BaRGS_00032491 [Batillaria attramentaria]|uniref:Uncharacterized protein n=1 Tax=Batillaria attramentaria TaxID=370345 RepID=A0ABD0JNE4_9CAEN